MSVSTKWKMSLRKDSIHINKKSELSNKANKIDVRSKWMKQNFN